jgi:hypothetical protein
LGEYFHLFFFSSFVSTLFFGGWELPTFIFYLVEFIYLLEGYDIHIIDFSMKMLNNIRWEIKYNIAQTLFWEQCDGKDTAIIIDYFVPAEHNLKVCIEYHQRRIRGEHL